jgi:hypothetical protein
VKAGSVRLNLSEDRKRYLKLAKDILSNLVEANHPDYHQMVLLKLAFANEGLGLLADSLAMLSDLITLQADNGVSLSYIIFKAAGTK